MNRRNIAFMRKYDIERIVERAVKNGGSLKAVTSRLGVVGNHMYALEIQQANAITNRDKIVIAPEASLTGCTATSKIIPNKQAIQRR